MLRRVSAHSVEGSTEESGSLGAFATGNVRLSVTKDDLNRQYERIKNRSGDDQTSPNFGPVREGRQLQQRSEVLIPPSELSLVTTFYVHDRLATSLSARESVNGERGCRNRESFDYNDMVIRNWHAGIGRGPVDLQAYEEFRAAARYSPTVDEGASRVLGERSLEDQRSFVTRITFLVLGVLVTGY